jgi:hypothetical protein
LGESDGGKETSIRLGIECEECFLHHRIANPGREIRLRRDFTYCSDVDPSFRVVWLYEYEVRFAPRCHSREWSGAKTIVLCPARLMPCYILQLSGYAVEPLGIFCF